MITEIMLFDEPELRFLNTCVAQNEPLANHTTFCVGGPADFYLCPLGYDFIGLALATLEKAKKNNIPLFILGGGSNVLAADCGFRGIVLDTTGFSGCHIEKQAEAGDKDGSKGGVEIICLAGTKSDDVANFALENSFCGLEFLAGLPGTIGGALWMNARCYESSVSERLGEVFIINEELKIEIVDFKKEDYGYKKSPFQTRRILIIAARLRVEAGNRADIENKMSGFRADREKKGHYSHPSAGSVFKNNHEFGKPSGQIIDELGLRGTQIGGARVFDRHGNFIINTGGASAGDIHALIGLIQKTAKESLGIKLEPEIIFLGNSDNKNA